MEILSPYPRINKPFTFLFTAIGNEKEGLSFILSFLLSYLNTIGNGLVFNL